MAVVLQSGITAITSITQRRDMEDVADSCGAKAVHYSSICPTITENELSLMP